MHKIRQFWRRWRVRRRTLAFLAAFGVAATVNIAYSSYDPALSVVRHEAMTDPVFRRGRAMGRLPSCTAAAAGYCAWVRDASAIPPAADREFPPAQGPVLPVAARSGCGRGNLLPSGADWLDLVAREWAGLAGADHAVRIYRRLTYGEDCVKGLRPDLFAIEFTGGFGQRGPSGTGRGGMPSIVSAAFGPPVSPFETTPTDLGRRPDVSPIDPPSVPLPPAGFLIVAALGGLLALRQRRAA